MTVPLAVLDDTYARLQEICEGYGLPTDVDALVEHLTGNQRLVGALTAHNEEAEALQHVGWLGPLGGLYPVSLPCPGRFDKPVFTHDRWLTKVPATERNKR